MSVLLRRKRMTTAYILDAVRTPRGRGKLGKGALRVVLGSSMAFPRSPPLAMCSRRSVC